jgi:membrane associated rhomboid family serine protease
MQEEQKKILQSVVYPFIFVAVLWIVKAVEVIFNINLEVYGLQPLSVKGLIGIITCPLLHAGFAHLFANSVPLFILASLLFYFYRVIAWRVIILVWLLTGLWVWFLASADSVHVGASGVVYGLAGFLFFSGIIRRETRLMAVTLLTAFLYGGMVWGVFPQFFPKEHISWESHLMGLIAGLILAVYYRKSGPQRKVYEWENEPDEDDNEDEDEDNPTRITGNIPPFGNIPKEPEDPEKKKDEGPDIRYYYKE